MAERFGEEVLNVGVGLGAVEVADTAAVQVFENLSDAAGNQIEFAPPELSSLGEGVENLVDLAQGVAPVVAAAAIIYAVFRHTLRLGRKGRG